MSGLFSSPSPPHHGSPFENSCASVGGAALVGTSFSDPAPQLDLRDFHSTLVLGKSRRSSSGGAEQKGAKDVRERHLCISSDQRDGCPAAGLGGVWSLTPRSRRHSLRWASNALLASSYGTSDPLMAPDQPPSGPSVNV